jgi:branched-subunit amino acid ABC-type transport system permease component
MPFTAFHLGPTLLIGILLFPFFDLAALLLCSVIVDLEPLYVTLFARGLPLHGFFHTFLGGTIVGIIVAIILWAVRGFVQELLAIFKIEQRSSFAKMLYTYLFSINFHIFLDSIFHADMQPFFPLIFNPFYGLISQAIINQLCTVCMILGLTIYVHRFIIHSVNKENERFTDPFQSQ